MPERKPGEREREVEANGLRMVCRVSGAGEPVVLVPGAGQAPAHWPAPLLERLSGHFEVIRYEPRGTGRTAELNGGALPGPREALRVCAADLVGLIEGLGHRRARLAGWGRGASVALEAAFAAPNRVLGLVLCGGLAEPGRYPPAAEVAGALSDFAGTAEEVRARRWAVCFPAPWWHRHREDFTAHLDRLETGAGWEPEVVARQQESWEAWPGLRAELPLINAPALVVTGMEDAVVPPRNATFLADNLREARLVLIDNAGHGLMYQYPHRFADAVERFLREEI